MIDYLFYRFYRLWLRSSIAEAAVFMAMLFFAVMLSVNFLTIWGILVSYNYTTLLTDEEYWILLGSLIFLLSSYLFCKKRYRRIIDRYDDRGNNTQGAIWLTIYIILSWFLFFWEALYRQGKI